MKAYAICLAIVFACALACWLLGRIVIVWVDFMIWLDKRRGGYQISLLIYALIVAALLWLMGIGGNFT